MRVSNGPTMHIPLLPRVALVLTLTPVGWVHLPTFASCMSPAAERWQQLHLVRRLCNAQYCTQCENKGQISPSSSRTMPEGRGPVTDADRNLSPQVDVRLWGRI